jgi:hypothetical protein
MGDDCSKSAVLLFLHIQQRLFDPLATPQTNQFRTKQSSTNPLSDHATPKIQQITLQNSQPPAGT